MTAPAPTQPVSDTVAQPQMPSDSGPGQFIVGLVIAVIGVLVLMGLASAFKGRSAGYETERAAFQNTVAETLAKNYNAVPALGAVSLPSDYLDTSREVSVRIANGSATLCTVSTNGQADQVLLLCNGTEPPRTSK